MELYLPVNILKLPLYLVVFLTSVQDQITDVVDNNNVVDAGHTTVLVNAIQQLGIIHSYYLIFTSPLTLYSDSIQDTVVDTNSPDPVEDNFDGDTIFDGINIDEYIASSDSMEESFERDDIFDTMNIDELTSTKHHHLSSPARSYFSIALY